MWGTMEFAVLGTLMVRDGDVDRTPSAPKLRRVLATLLFRSNKLVLAETLAEELWQHDPPPTAMATLQTYVYQLRKALGSDGRDRDGMIRTQTDPSGYVLTVNPEQLDLVRFRSLLREAGGLQHRPGADAAEGGPLPEGKSVVQDLGGPVGAMLLQRGCCSVCSRRTWPRRSIGWGAWLRCSVSGSPSADDT